MNNRTICRKFFSILPNITRKVCTTGTRKRKFVAVDDRSKAAHLDSDAQILWRINWMRMERFFRDDLILDAISGSVGSELLDKSALRVTQLLLKVGEVRSTLLAGQSSPISV